MIFFSQKTVGKALLRHFDFKIKDMYNGLGGGKTQGKLQSIHPL
jgi:hypothetical protein